MARLSMSVVPLRRSATVKLDAVQARYNDESVGLHPCHVLGLFQCTDADEVNPYFICELHSGKCVYADPINVTFKDTNEEGELIE